MKMQKISILCALLLVSCSTPAVVSPVDDSKLTDFPATPALVKYSKPPVIQKVEENFLVTGELITNSTLLTDYFIRLEAWKKKNDIQ